MKRLKIGIIIMYVFFIFFLFDLAMTGKTLLSVQSIDSALDLLNHKHLFLVRFFGVVMDYAYSIPKLITEIIAIIPIGLTFFFVYLGLFVWPYVKGAYKYFYFIIPVVYCLLSVFIIFSLQSYNVNFVLTSVKIVGFITFLIAIALILTSLTISFLFGCEFIDVVRGDVIMKREKERTYDRKL